MLENLWASLKAKWPPNRVVAALTPIVFVPLAGFIATWVADNFPGLPPMDPNWLAGIFVTGAAAALAAAYKWLDGWQKWENNPANGEAIEGDSDFILSQPDDTAESDSDEPDDPERRQRDDTETLRAERDELDSPQ